MTHALRRHNVVNRIDTFKNHEGGAKNVRNACLTNAQGKIADGFLRLALIGVHSGSSANRSPRKKEKAAAFSRQPPSRDTSQT